MGRRKGDAKPDTPVISQDVHIRDVVWECDSRYHHVLYNRGLEANDGHYTYIHRY